MSDASINRINSLNAEEVVKDILKGWEHLRETYPDQIRKFQFSKLIKRELVQLAQKFYEKYSKVPHSLQTKVLADKGVLEEFFSVQIYGKETYPIFTYPYTILVAESINPDILNKLFDNWPSFYVNLERFIHLFLGERWNTVARFSSIDLQLLKTFFSDIETQSSIAFPDTSEFLYPNVGFTQRTAQYRYRRFLDLQILTRRSIINYAKLGLTPLLKIYEENENSSQIELNFSIWESSLSPNKTLRLLVVPPYGSFWYKYSAKDVYLLQSRVGGINIDLFNGKDWKLVNLFQSIDRLPNNVELSPYYYKMNFMVDSVKFGAIDLRILRELIITPERHIKYIGPRINLKESGYIPKRLQWLRNNNVFQTYFRLNNAGINDSYYLLAIGNEDDLLTICKFAYKLPRYYIAKSKNCIFALLWLPSEARQMFLNACSRLRSNLSIQELYYGIVNQEPISPPNLIKFWDGEEKRWKMEP
ncbi:MAG: hypothetical protein ACFE9R_20175 [Candidatus Hermodarchaeota archaeon]